MAAADPLIGTVDAWRGDPIAASAADDDVPVLYHTDSSYYSCILRLALEEKGVRWRSRSLDIHSALEQLQPWYMQISPGACVPTLVHRGRAVPESRDILAYLDKTFRGDGHPDLTPPEGTPELGVNASFMDLAYGFDVELMTMGYPAEWNPLFRRMGPKMIRGGIEKLKALKGANPGLAGVIDRKIAQNEARIRDIFGPPPGFQRGLESYRNALDRLEAQLEAGGGPFICGGQYCWCDVVFANILARGNWIGPGREELAKRKRAAEYFETVRRREAFRAADVWAAFRLGKIGEMAAKKIQEALKGLLGCCG